MILYEKKDKPSNDPDAALGTNPSNDPDESLGPNPTLKRLRQLYNAARASDRKVTKSDLDRKLRQRALKIRNKTEKRKREQFRWMKAQSEENKRRRENASNPTPPKQLINPGDSDATATDKTLENISNALRKPVGDLATAAIKRGVVKPFLSKTETGRFIKGSIKTPEEREKIQKKRNRREKKIVKAGKGELLDRVRGRMQKTPLTQRPGFKKFVRAIKTDVKTGIGKVKSSNPLSSAGVPAPQRTGLQRLGRRITNPFRIGAVQRERINRRNDSLLGKMNTKFGGNQASAPSQNPVRRSIPQRLRRIGHKLANAPRWVRDAQIERYYSREDRNGNNISEFYGTYDYSSYLEEQYCFWKEEFLMDLRGLREAVKEKKRIIDVIKGKRKRNKITMHPTVTEGYKYLPEEINGASIFAKATPPLKKRTTPLSDIVLVKQPGKETAEKVRDKMVKLFLGDRRNYYANYDFSGHKADDNDMNNESR